MKVKKKQKINDLLLTINFSTITNKVHKGEFFLRKGVFVPKCLMRAAARQTHYYDYAIIAKKQNKAPGQ